MRKQITQNNIQGLPANQEQIWLDLEQLAQVELTSEDADHPIESALLLGASPGWRAQQPGKQTIRLLFDNPCTIKRIYLVFQENKLARTQEFVLRWSSDSGASYQEIVRQQFNFSPPNVSRELEDYTVELDGLTILELSITPDISRGDTLASLTQLRLA